MMYLAWKVLGILGRFRWREKYDSQNIFVSQFKLWALAPLQISASLCEGPIYLLLCKKKLSLHLLFQSTKREHYCHTCALDVANIWVCFMNLSTIEHNGLGITFFSVDILKDMVACWYAWVLMSSCQIIDYCLNHSTQNFHATKEKNMWIIW